ncbi:MAG: DUF547 domain-containing protein [Hyphomonadaceae bacterium]|nr:DUF547 domain-containing protein [Hyphomonadaceae bacterium]
MTLAAGNAAADDTDLHAAWDEILGTYVVEGEDGVNRFDYGALKASTADSAKLDDYLTSFSDFDIETLDENEQFAAYSNIYNALTVQYIVGRYPTKSIRSGYIVGPWKRVFTEINGEEVSLDHIEHEILRVEWDDPRVHYAVNCAAYSCPNLQADAWFGETLDEDLDRAARAYVNDPRGVTIRNNGTLQVSTIYKWFREDFGGSNDGVIDHLLQYAEPELATQIQAKRRITKHEYDWDLNDVE